MILGHMTNGSGRRTVNCCFFHCGRLSVKSLVLNSRAMRLIQNTQHFSSLDNSYLKIMM